MLYAIEQGPIEQRIMEQAMRNGQPLPKKIANAPELHAGNEFFYMAYSDLNCDEGMTWEAVTNYAAFYGCDWDTFLDLQYHMAKMDAARNEYYQKKAEQN